MACKILCTKDDFNVLQNSIQIDKMIGSGSFSNVFLGKYNNNVIAIKKQKCGTNNEIQQYIWRELTVLKKLEHDHILHYIGACNDMNSGEIWILTEYLECGDVNSLLKHSKLSSLLTWKHWIRIALDAATGIQFLHSNNVIHRDIKSANLLINNSLRCKLCDFGFARDNENIDSNNINGVKRRMSLCGTDAYMAPEIYFDEAYDEKVDIFSFGVVLIEMITKKQVNVDGFLMRLPQKAFRLDLDEIEIDPTCPPSLFLLAKSCCSFEADDRPNAKEAVEWLTDLLNDLSMNKEEKLKVTDQEIVSEIVSFLSDNSFKQSSLASSCTSDISSSSDASSSHSQSKNCKEKFIGKMNQMKNMKNKKEKIPSHVGFLFKRNRKGIKTWTRRWVVLEGKSISYFKSLNEEEKMKNSNVHQHLLNPQAIIDLTNCKIKKMPNYHFKIISQTLGNACEFAASSDEEMILWISKIRKGIKYGNKIKLSEKCKPNKINHLFHTTGKEKKQLEPEIQEHFNNIDEDNNNNNEIDITYKFEVDQSDIKEKDELVEWLQGLNIENYYPNFLSKGFHSLDYVRDIGIEEDDLNMLEINDCKIRQIVIDAVKELRDEENNNNF